MIEPGNASGEVVSRVFDGKPTWGSLPDNWLYERTVTPITVIEGPENCGSGKVTIEGGEIVAHHRDNPGNLRTFRATANGRWWNYGAPHGTHVEVEISWARI